MYNINGVLFLDKPKGLSSNIYLQIIKKKLKIKKAGYIGTLDPIATGILPLCFGEATKFIQFLSNSDKYYYVEAILGYSTSTYDVTGKKNFYNNKIPNLNKIIKILNLYKGIIYQRPPLFSSIKINGIPCYKYALKNINIKLSKKKIYIYEINILDYNYKLLKLLIHCSKGTYIRSLINSIGEKLNCGAYVLNLRRIQISNYIKITHTLKINKILKQTIKTIYKYLYPINILLQNLHNINLNNYNDYKKFINGGIINNYNNIFRKCYIKVTYGYKKYFLGIAKTDKRGNIIPYKLLSNINYDTI